YSGHYVKELLGARVDDVLRNTWFWLAQYGPKAVVPPCWPRWTLWQYTDGGLGPEPHSVDGVGRCDRDRFNGGLGGLKPLWGVQAGPSTAATEQVQPSSVATKQTQSSGVARTRIALNRRSRGATPRKATRPRRSR